MNQQWWVCNLGGVGGYLFFYLNPPVNKQNIFSRVACNALYLKVNKAFKFWHKTK